MAQIEMFSTKRVTFHHSRTERTSLILSPDSEKPSFLSKASLEQVAVKVFKVKHNSRVLPSFAVTVTVNLQGIPFMLNYLNKNDLKIAFFLCGQIKIPLFFSVTATSSIGREGYLY